MNVGNPLEVDPASGVAALVTLIVPPPKPENNALQAQSQMVTNRHRSGDTYVGQWLRPFSR